MMASAARAYRKQLWYSGPAFDAASLGALVYDDWRGPVGAALATGRIPPRRSAAQAWTLHNGAAALAGNRQLSSDHSSVGLLLASADYGAADAILTTTVRLGASGTGRVAGILARYSNTQNYWRVVLDPVTSSGQVRLIKLVANSATTVATTNIALSSGVDYTLELRVHGDTWQIYLNGAQVGTDVTDSALNSNTRHGLYAFNATGSPGATFGPLTVMPYADATVTVGAPLLTSQLELGAILANNWSSGSNLNQAAFDRMAGLAPTLYHYGVVYIHGYGGTSAPYTNAIKAAEAGDSRIRDPQSEWTWTSLDRAIGWVASMGLAPQIVFLGAPGWMKTDSTTQATWDTLDFDATVAVTDAHIAGYAAMCAEIARRYPQVSQFGLWGEAKGLYTDAGGTVDTTGVAAEGVTNNWQYKYGARLHTAVRAAVRAVNPAVQLGTMYIRVEGSGAWPQLGQTLYSGAKYNTNTGTWKANPITARDQTCYTWFLANSFPDTLDFDYGLLKAAEDETEYSPLSDRFALAGNWGTIVNTLKGLSGASGKPVRVMEHYPALNQERTNAQAPAEVQSLDYQAAMIASMFKHLIEAGAAFVGQWSPDKVNDADRPYAHNSFTAINTADGGAALEPIYSARKAIKDHFGKGAGICACTVTGTGVSALASDHVVLLINQTAAAVTVRIAGQAAAVSLAAYEVKAVDR